MNKPVLGYKETYTFQDTLLEYRTAVYYTYQDTPLQYPNTITDDIIRWWENTCKWKFYSYMREPLYEPYAWAK